MNSIKWKRHLLAIIITAIVVGLVIALINYVSFISKIIEILMSIVFLVILFVFWVIGLFLNKNLDNLAENLMSGFIYALVFVLILVIYSFVYLLITVVKDDADTKLEDSVQKPSIRKKIYGNREWLREAKQSNEYDIALDTLYSVNFEVNAENVRRPVGALVTLSHAVLQSHHQQILDGLAARSQETLRANPPAFWNLVEHKNTEDFDYYHRTHAIAHVFSLDEGETPGITFTGTGYLDSGNDYQNGLIFQSREESEDGKDDPRHNILVEVLFDYYLDKKRSGNYDSDNLVCEFLYPIYNFTKLSEAGFNQDDIRATANRGEISQISMLHFERLASKIINFFKDDEFIYSCELLYQSVEDRLVYDVELVLYNCSQDRTEYIVRLANLE